MRTTIHKVCNSVAVQLGVLGNTRHYRCTGCGMIFSRQIKRKSKKTNNKYARVA